MLDIVIAGGPSSTDQRPPLSGDPASARRIVAVGDIAEAQRSSMPTACRRAGSSTHTHWRGCSGPVRARQRPQRHSAIGGNCGFARGAPRTPTCGA
jgi:hypothetical protein